MVVFAVNAGDVRIGGACLARKANRTTVADGENTTQYCLQNPDMLLTTHVSHFEAKTVGGGNEDPFVKAMQKAKARQLASRHSGSR